MLLVFQVAVVAEDQVVVAQLVLHAGGVDAGLAARVGEHDDEGVVVGMLERCPQDQARATQRCDLAQPRKPMISRRLMSWSCERAEHLVEEVGEVEREVVREVGEAEALEGLGGGAADFRVVYETLICVKRTLELHK